MTLYQKLIPPAGLLIFAPHPDDDVLSCGVLIQRARAANVPVHIIFLTSGESNPWPQRYVERKLIINRSDSLRWAKTRMAEARAALGSLGVTEDRIQFLQWPDLGITDLLMSGSDEPISALAEILNRVKPGAIVAPALSDLHPDHSAAAVLLELTKKRLIASASAIDWFWYLVHTPKIVERAADIVTVSTPAEREIKRTAIAFHKTQITLSSRRFLGFADTPEKFFSCTTPSLFPFSVTRSGSRLLLDLKESLSAQFFPRRLLLRGDKSVHQLIFARGEPLSKEIHCSSDIAQSDPLFFKYEFRPIFRDRSGWAVVKP